MLHNKHNPPPLLGAAGILFWLLAGIVVLAVYKFLAAPVLTGLFSGGGKP